jgi:hypothetical protein
MNSVKKIAMLIFVALPSVVCAGEAQVKWHDFNDYRDVRPSNQTKGSYHKQIAKSIDEHFAKLSEQLPKNYSLKIEVTDLDLAGDVRYGGVNEIRVVKPIHFPRIEFNYVLSDESGVVAQEDNVSLKDMGFMDKIKMGRDEAFYYEKRLLTEWFGEQVLPRIK